MISPHLFGFRNISSVLVKALAKHSLYRSKADSRKTVTHTFEMQGTKCSLEHNAKDMFICLQQLTTMVIPTKSIVCSRNPLSQVGYVFSSEQFEQSLEIVSFKSFWRAEDAKLFSIL